MYFRHPFTSGNHVTRASVAASPAPDEFSLVTARSIDSEVADLLYRHGVGGLFVSLLGSSALALIAMKQSSTLALGVWWALMSVILTVRALDILQVRRSAALLRRSGRSLIFRFGIGLIAAAVTWAMFPVVFFEQLDETGRAFTAIIVSAMVGGSGSVLAPSRTLSICYCACLLLPTSFVFLKAGGSKNVILGILGCTFFLIMVLSSRVTNQATLRAIRLSQELSLAQSSLQNINQSLEGRIEARTADLALEVREKERYAKDLAYLASTDSLTGLCNRLTIVRFLGEAIDQASTRGDSLAVLFVDLDKFKEVNDVLGHFAGDNVLRAAAHRLSSSLSSSECLGRWGGDEFVIALRGSVTRDSAVELAYGLRESLRKPIDIDLGTVTIDATIGIALFPDHGRTHEDLIRAADMAMYDGKQRRCKVCLFHPKISEQLTERLFLEQSLRGAIAGNQLTLVYQPIIASQSGRCEIVEALTRWRHPQRGAISPTRFIPIAERTGDINAMGRWALREACLEAAMWPRLGPGADTPAVSVNVSAVQIHTGSLVCDVLAALKESALPPHRLHLELTESVFAADHSFINPVLRSLRDKGISISLDDFGTGFSCLSYLRRLPIDMIKIDQSFTSNIAVDSRPIIQTIITTAQAFGLKTVAEGVETILQASSMVAMKADYMQGHLFATALTQAELTKFLWKNGGTPTVARPGNFESSRGYTSSLPFVSGTHSAVTEAKRNAAPQA